jgi:hypothetical protein
MSMLAPRCALGDDASVQSLRQRHQRRGISFRQKALMLSVDDASTGSTTRGAASAHRGVISKQPEVESAKAPAVVTNPATPNAINQLRVCIALSSSISRR